MGDINKITNALLSFSDQIDPKELFPALIPEVADFVINNPYALTIAISLDRGGLTELFWTIPYYLFEQLGHLDPNKINSLTLVELATVFSKLPYKPWFINDALRTVKELTDIIMADFDGDASLIWKGKSAFDVKCVFQSVYGVGRGIANKSVLLIEKVYKIEFSDLYRKKIDIKDDIYTMKVLTRLGVSKGITQRAAMEAARKMNPKYPGQLDAPLRIIGRKWCHFQNPDCQFCPMNNECQKIGLN